MQVRNHTDDLMKRLQTADEADSQPTEPQDRERLAITQPDPGAMVVTNRLDIEGEAEDNQIISLSADGKLLSATIAQNGKFSFENIKAKRGQNLFTIKAISESVLVNTLETIEFYFSRPPLEYLTRSFDRGARESKRIAMTFDAGSTNNAAMEILDALKETRVHCTMFLTGQFIRRYPETVKRMVSEGHEIGNHTWSHPHLTTFAENLQHVTLPGISRELLHDELLSTEELFRSLTKKEMVKFWRAPFGEHNREIRRWAAELGYRQVGWTLGRDWQHSMDTLDWVADKNSSAYRSAEEISEKILTFAKQKPHGANGAIILMHLGTHRDDDFPHRKLPEIIDGLHSQGYRLVKISDMLSDGRG